MKLSEIAQQIQAQFHGPDSHFLKVAIDSRKVEPGDFFVALKGENNDGHEFISDAIAKGATAIMAQRAPLNDKEKSVTFLQVTDTIAALGLFAAFWRKQYTLPVVGLTGSCGKTTVKEMIAAICSQQGKTLATTGNLNNHIGLPLTLLKLDPTYQYAVIEMGANHAGEIAYLGRIAQPNIALITTVANAHLQGFGSLEGVAKAKGEIFDILPANGIALLNADLPFVDYWRTIIGDRKSITFGLKKHAKVYATQIALLPFHVEFTLHLPAQPEIRIMINIPGEHTVNNALAAASAAYALNIPQGAIQKGLENFQGVKGRLRRFAGFNGAWIFDDTYNANPGSMMAALEVLAACPGQKVFIMGDMGELGPDAITYHKEIGEFARQKGIERLFAVGELSEYAVQAFGIGGKSFADKQTLVNEIKTQLNSQTVVLVKGSRSAGMEIVSNALVLTKG